MSCMQQRMVINQSCLLEISVLTAFSQMNEKSSHTHLATQASRNA